MKKTVIFSTLAVFLVIGFIILINSNNKTSIEIGEYLNLEIEYEDLVIDEKELDERMKEELTEKLEYTTVKNRGVKKGDVVNIDFEGKQDGVPFDGGKSEDYDLEIGSGAFVPGFEDQLIGMKVEDIRDINITFPEEYHSEELAGQEVVFTVKLNAIKVREKLPKITDKLVKKLTDGEFKTISKFKSYLKGIMQEDIDQRNNQNKEEALWKAIMDNSKIEKLPNKNIKYYEKMFNDYYEGYAANFEMDLETFVQQYLNSDMKEFKEEKAKYAKNHVSKYELSKIISKNENITFTEEEFEDHLEKYNYNVEEIEESKSYIENEVLYEIITMFLLENTTFI